jgi:hypothetical protein
MSQKGNPSRRANTQRIELEKREKEEDREKKRTYNAGVSIQKKNTKPTAMLASAHQGVARGEPM